MMKIGGVEYMEIDMIMISSQALFSVVNNCNIFTKSKDDENWWLV